MSVIAVATSTRQDDSMTAGLHSYTAMWDPPRVFGSYTGRVASSARQWQFVSSGSLATARAGNPQTARVRSRTVYHSGEARRHGRVGQRIHRDYGRLRGDYGRLRSDYAPETGPLQALALIITLRTSQTPLTAARRSRMLPGTEQSGIATSGASRPPLAARDCGSTSTTPYSARIRTDYAQHTQRIRPYLRRGP